LTVSPFFFSSLWLLLCILLCLDCI
jgi:hypothetical protein